jgi:hypothetical protein
MATNKRTYPNDNFAWYNDDKRLAILCLEKSSDTTENTREPYDTWQGDGNLSGNITATSTAGGSFVDMTSTSHGLAVGDRVKISGTTTYDGNHEVTVVGDANTFRISATNSTSNEGASSGVTWASLFIDNGLRITYHAKYEDISTTNLDKEMSDSSDGIGLDTGMQNALLCYVKARLFEDQNDLQQAQYFRQMYERAIKQYPSRKSGVRQLAVPRL